MNTQRRLSLFILALFATLYPGLLYADEVIRSFHSDIQVFESGDMRVRETIVVQSEGNKIRRGIYRDFPTRYKDNMGNNYVVGFNIVSIRRDGQNEKFHTENRSNGIRIYIGDKNRTLRNGIYSFELTYRTNRQLGFFDSHDELYWNVTGNDWAFPILKATASVKLPDGISADEIKLNGYTGFSGSRGKDFIADVTSAGIAQFETTSELGIKEGLTIVVGFPKGFVIEPDLKQKMAYILEDNQGLLVGLGGLLLIMIYYLYVWFQVGRDPEAGVIIPHYEPPKDYSPAAMRFISRMGYDQTCFAAALVNLAVKGHVKIAESAGTFFLEKLRTNEIKPAWDETVLMNELFGHHSSITLKQSNHKRIAMALDEHESVLEKNYEKVYFKTNAGSFILGLVLTVIVLGITLFSQIQADDNVAALFMIVWLGIWSMVVCGLISNAWHEWKRAHSASGYIKAFHLTFFAGVFLLAEVVAIFIFTKISSLLFPVLIVVAVLINWLFYELLKAPTRAGRKLLDKIQGFKNYIDIAEKQELDYKYAGGKTPELFERILPYAIALGVEEQWSRQFEDVLAQASIGEQHYSPSWYRGSNWSSSNISGFTNSVSNSLGNAIASSSRAPGSSSGGGFSGGGGGGSSGGGGGGGGGGGW